jgi:CRISPR-associated protein Cmr1
MDEIKATFRIVTPMFLGGANHEPDGIRPPSIKGALRFWWRAINWGRALNESGNNEEAALKWLHQEETRLFGHAANDGGGGQGVFLLRVTQQPKNLQTFEEKWPVNQKPSGYLGLGLFESGKVEKGNYQPHRKGIKEGQEFQISLLFKPSSAETDRASVVEALEAFGLFGALGSRARRGFGAVTLIELGGAPYKPSASLSAYSERSAQLLKDCAASASPLDYPPYTAITTESLFKVVVKDKDARQTHSTLGSWYKKYRGQESTLRGKVKKPFGLPLAGVSEDRRASPLFFHVHQTGESEFVGALLFLPALFESGMDDQTDHRHYFRLVRQFVESQKEIA